MDQLYARNVYGQTLVEIGKKDNNIVVLDADLSGSTRTSYFAKEFPDRFFNFGVAEQNMMATAAGLASYGKTVFASTFAMFATIRALDQVRNSIAYNDFNVKIVATHGGITVGEDGASHQALEDVGVMRLIPNMKIIVPADGVEAKSAIIAAYETKGTFYVRLGRSKIKTIPNKKKFEFGKGYMLKEGKDCCIIACGIMVQEALDACDILKEKGIDPAVANIHTIKPIDKEFIKKIAKQYKRIVVCEEHQSIGGLFSAVCEVLSTQKEVSIASVGVGDKFGQSGDPKELMDKYELSSPHIAKKVEETIKTQSN